MPSIVVDAGGTQLRCAVADDRGTISYITREPIANFLRTGNGDIWRSIAVAIERYCDSVEAQTDCGTTLIVAVPGPVAESSRLIEAPTICGGAHGAPDLRAHLESASGRTVLLINDVSAAAWYVADRVEDDRFLVVTVSSGIGSKIFDRRHTDRVLDADPFAGEIGHLVVDTAEGAPCCDCGGRGHLGAISSGRGTERLAQLLSEEDVHTFRSSLLYRRFHVAGDAIRNELHLVPAAMLGDPWALDVIAHAAQPLACVLAPLIIGAGLERVVVMGGFAQRLGATYRAILDRELRRFIESSGFPFPAREYIQVLGDEEEAGLAGAAALYRNRCGLAV